MRSPVCLSRPSPLVAYAAFALAALSSGTASAEPTVAIAGFDYSDTSGEIASQASNHETRLALLSATVLEELGKERIPAMSVTCGNPPCSAGAMGMEDLLAAAKNQGSKYLVYGGIHKMSTLIQWVKIEMVDLAAGKVIASQLLSLRGDTEEAYRRAGRFVSKMVVQSRLQTP